MPVRIHDSLLPLLVPADQVRPHPQNARNGDTDAIGESMRENGVYRPVYAQRSTGHILAGNHTYASLLEAGHDQVPVLWLDVDNDQALRILLADNRTADLGRYDDALLAETLQVLGDLAGTGYDEHDLSDLLASLQAPDLDDLHDDVGDPVEEDTFVTISARVPAPTAERWTRTLEATGQTSPIAQAVALVAAAWTALGGEV